MRNQYKILSEKYNLVTETEKEDILGGLDAFAKSHNAHKIWYVVWSLDDVKYNLDRGVRPRISPLKEVNLDQAVRILWQTDEFQDKINANYFPEEDIFMYDEDEPYTGVPEYIKTNLYEYLKKHDGVATMVAPHYNGFYVVGLDEESTAEEAENVFMQTIEDIDDIMDSHKNDKRNIRFNE